MSDAGWLRFVLVVCYPMLGACASDTTPPQGANQTAPGADRTARTVALETSADLLQSKGPIDRISMHLVGFHPGKDDPALQMESHHFCDQVNEDFAQCVLYDGDADNARLHGIEYIISERLYATLPDQEKPYWHPHNYEILSGTLRLPHVPSVAEQAALRDKMNSYGKTWHVWKTGVTGETPDPLPLGPAHLAWSFNYDGEARPGLIEERDRRMNLDTGEARRARAELRDLAKPQAGVDVLRDAFPGATRTTPGVSDNGDPHARPVPRMVIR
jgi:hypothetical protein